MVQINFGLLSGTKLKSQTDGFTNSFATVPLWTQKSIKGRCDDAYDIFQTGITVDLRRDTNCETIPYTSLTLKVTGPLDSASIGLRSALFQAVRLDLRDAIIPYEDQSPPASFIRAGYTSVVAFGSPSPPLRENAEGIYSLDSDTNVSHIFCGQSINGCGDRYHRMSKYARSVYKRQSDGVKLPVYVSIDFIFLDKSRRATITNLALLTIFDNISASFRLADVVSSSQYGSPSSVSSALILMGNLGSGVNLIT